MYKKKIAIFSWGDRAIYIYGCGDRAILRFFFEKIANIRKSHILPNFQYFLTLSDDNLYNSGLTNRMLPLKTRIEAGNTFKKT